MNKPKIELNVIDENSVSQADEINGIEWALVGGSAINIYGSDRLTKAIEIIAEKQIVGRLKQGGERYNIETEEKIVTID